jgi:hypothetical protein
LMTIFLSAGWGYYQLFPKELIFFALYLVNEVYSTIIKGCSWLLFEHQ